MIKKTLKINGVERILILDKDETLAQVLRNHLLLTGCKIGCGEGHCGACNVIMNGKVTRSCIYKMSRVPDNAEITTIEGVGTISDMHPIQVAWMAYGCAQCGFCSPGFIISAKVLLDNNPSPTREEVRDWFNKQRNLCRCTGYKPLIDATMAAAAVMRGEMTKEDLVFKQTGDSIVGTNYIRPSAAQKVTGTWDFGADDALKMPEGTLRPALTQAKVSHANILSIDTTEAESMPGVVRVITAKDIKAAGGTNKINGLVMLPKHNKTDGFERPVLCDEKIFQFGDAIAIVAADTEEHARAAADAVKVEIEELPAYMNAMDAIAPDAAEIHPGTPNAFFETNCIKGPDFDWDSPNVLPLFDMTARYGLPYFQNFINSELKPNMIRSMCCRLQLDLRELLKRGNGLFGSAEQTGSLGVVTINCARLGYLFKGSEEALFARLDHLLELARDSLEIKRKTIQKHIDQGLFPYTKRYLGTLRNHFSTIGVNGLNEMIRNFTDDAEDITTEKGHDLAVRLLDHVRARMVEFQTETGHMYNLEATPAEGTTYRFAKEDKKRFPDILEAGTPQHPYYTNSSQLPVGYTDDPFEALEMQEDLQRKYTGGTVLHLYMNEAISSAEACRDLVRRTLTRFRLPYITVTPTFSICPKHGYLSGRHDFCPKCDAELLAAKKARELQKAA